MKTLCLTTSVVKLLMLHKKWLALLGLAIFLSACTKAPEYSIAQGRAGELQFQVVYLPVTSNQTERRVVERVHSLLTHLEQQLSSENAESEVARVNNWAQSSALVLTRDLEEFIRVGMSVDMLTEHGLSLFQKASQSPLPHVFVENHRLIKTDPSLKLTFDALISGYAVDRIAVMMRQMGVVNYQITVNNQRRSKRFRVMSLANDIHAGQRIMDVEHDINARSYSLGFARGLQGAEVYVVYHSAAHASGLAQWLANMPVAEALVTADRLNLAVSIHSDANNSVTRYNSAAFN